LAETVKILLKGGPCDGLKTTARRADFGPVSVVCKGVRYQPTAQVTKGGRLIYTTQASQQTGGVTGDSGGAVPAKAHKAWHHMLRTVFVDAPTELRHSYNARAAIRRLRHRPGLK
jgi:hypothetical protein